MKKVAPEYARIRSLTPCQECKRVFDPNAGMPWGKGGIVGVVQDGAERGQPFAYCDTCLDTGGYCCTVVAPRSASYRKWPKRKATAQPEQQQSGRPVLQVLKGGKRFKGERR